MPKFLCYLSNLRILCLEVPLTKEIIQTLSRVTWCSRSNFVTSCLEACTPFLSKWEHLSFCCPWHDLENSVGIFSLVFFEHSLGTGNRDKRGKVAEQKLGSLRLLSFLSLQSWLTGFDRPLCAGAWWSCTLNPQQKRLEQCVSSCRPVWLASRPGAAGALP